jgi:hypothetical protein
MSIEILITNKYWELHYRDLRVFGPYIGQSVPPGITFVFLTDEGKRSTSYTSYVGNIATGSGEYGGYTPDTDSYKVFTRIWVHHLKKNPYIEDLLPIMED